jgi:hypothetical protein
MESVQLVGSILTIIATEAVKDKVIAGGTPIFIVQDVSEQQEIALLLSNTLDAVTHDLENGLLMIVRH